MCSITITNEGRGEATDLIMHFPDATHVEYYGGGIPEQERRPSMDKLFYQLETSLPQGGEINVLVWTECKPERKYGEELAISCEGDTARIQVCLPVMGFAQFMSNHPVCTIVLGGVIWLLMPAFFWVRHRRHRV
jgi:hypothetical protein